MTPMQHTLSGRVMPKRRLAPTPFPPALRPRELTTRRRPATWPARGHTGNFCVQHTGSCVEATLIVMDHQGTGPSRPSAASLRQPAWTPRDGDAGAGVPEDDSAGPPPGQGSPGQGSPGQGGARHGAQRAPGSFGYGPGGFDALDDGSAGNAGPARGGTGEYRTTGPGPGGAGTGGAGT